MTHTTADPRYWKQWQLDRQRGLERMTPAARAREYVTLLVEKGWSHEDIAEAAGVSDTTVQYLAAGARDRIRTDTHDRIMGLSADAIFTRTKDTGYVPAIGTRRRVQALMAIGWRSADINAAIGSSPLSMLIQSGGWVTRRKHDLIVAAYNRMWDQPGPSKQTAAYAKRHGYLAPMWWDDDTIDDPTHTPDTGADVHDGLVTIREIEYLLDSGAGQAQILHQLGYTSYKSLERLCLRYGRSDLASRVRTTGQGSAA